VSATLTDGARRVLISANQEAARCHQPCVGSEHLLLGLAHDESALGGGVLRSFGVRVESIRAKVEELALPWEWEFDVGIHPPRTPKAKQAVGYAIFEAHRLGHQRVGPEHILLGLLRETEDVAAQILMSLGINPALVRETVFERLESSTTPTGPRPRASSVIRRAMIVFAHVTDWLREMKYDATAHGNDAWRAVLTEEQQWSNCKMD
jgi:ATP-dependent Clp protease ATP-binding subunit ClpC